MAGKTIRAQRFIYCGTGLVLCALISGCKVEPVTSEDTRGFSGDDKAVAPYIQSLALIQSGMEDFEGSLQGLNTTTCVRSYSCTVSDPLFDTTYSNCLNPRGLRLSGATQIKFQDQLTCQENASQATYSADTWIKKNFSGPLDIQSSQGIVQTRSPGGLLATYRLTGNSSISMDPVEREMENTFHFRLQIDQPLVFTGRRSNATRKILYGRMLVQDLGDGKDFELNFNQLRWEDANCCLPTSGDIRGVVSGQNPETLYFRGCGVAELDNGQGQVKRYNLANACD